MHPPSLPRDGALPQSLPPAPSSLPGEAGGVPSSAVAPSGAAGRPAGHAPLHGYLASALFICGADHTAAVLMEIHHRYALSTETQSLWGSPVVYDFDKGLQACLVETAGRVGTAALAARLHSDAQRGRQARAMYAGIMGLGSAQATVPAAPLPDALRPLMGHVYALLDWLGAARHATEPTAVAGAFFVCPLLNGHFDLLLTDREWARAGGLRGRAWRAR